MLKANIKLPLWLGIIAILLSALFSLFDFSPIVIVIYIGTLYLIVYFIVGFIKRKDALIIDNELIQVKSPFKYREWIIKDIKNIYIVDNGSMLKAVILEEDQEIEVTICSNIYDKSLNEILQVIIENNSELQKHIENL